MLSLCSHKLVFEYEEAKLVNVQILCTSDLKHSQKWTHSISFISCYYTNLASPLIIIKSLVILPPCFKLRNISPCSITALIYHAGLRIVFLPIL